MVRRLSWISGCWSRGSCGGCCAARHTGFAKGTSPAHLARGHLMPHLAAPLLAGAGIVFSGAVLAEAGLAFVGLGDQRVTSWGRMAAQGFGLLGLA